MKTTSKAVPVTIGLDIAKNSFQAHAVDAAGQVVLRRKLSRGDVLRFFAAQPKAMVGIEACGTGHYWAREIAALGHEVKLLPPTYVKAYVKRGKIDAADAEAICEAVARPNMHFVPIKTPAQQAAADDAPVARVTHRAADGAGERPSRPPGRVRHRRRQGHPSRCRSPGGAARGR
jgi:transposase